MSMPHEKTRALIGTGDFLRELRARNDLPAEVMQGVIWCLRHYPSAIEIRHIGLRDENFALHEDYDEDKRLREVRSK